MAFFDFNKLEGNRKFIVAAVITLVAAGIALTGHMTAEVATVFTTLIVAFFGANSVEWASKAWKAGKVISDVVVAGKTKGPGEAIKVLFEEGGELFEDDPVPPTPSEIAPNSPLKPLEADPAVGQLQG